MAPHSHPGGNSSETRLVITDFPLCQPTPADDGASPVLCLLHGDLGQSLGGLLVTTHRAERRGVDVHADRGGRRGVAYVVDVVTPERARLAGLDRTGAAGPALLETAQDDRERTLGLAMVVEAGGLARKPADQPHFVVVVVVQALVPAAVGAQPDAVQPLIGPLGQRPGDLGEARRGGRKGDGGHSRSLLDLCGRTAVVNRSLTQRAGLPSKIDVQARMERGAEMHSPSLGHIAY